LLTLELKKMKRLALLLVVIGIASCESAQLKQENQVLRAKVVELERLVDKHQKLAEEAAIRAKQAQAEAERQAVFAKEQLEKVEEVLAKCD